MLSSMKMGTRRCFSPRYAVSPSLKTSVRRAISGSKRLSPKTLSVALELYYSYNITLFNRDFSVH